MNRICFLLAAAMPFLSTASFGADSATDSSTANLQNRLCNLQGREISLRISEEVISALSAEARTRIADIAEQVCVEYASQTTSYSVIQRPVVDESSELSLNEGVEESINAESEDSGLFGEMKIIDPEDRVRRPGLKRR